MRWALLCLFVVICALQQASIGNGSPYSNTNERLGGESGDKILPEAPESRLDKIKALFKRIIEEEIKDLLFLPSTPSRSVELTTPNPIAPIDPGLVSDFQEPDSQSRSRDMFSQRKTLVKSPPAEANKGSTGEKMTRGIAMRLPPRFGKRSCAAQTGITEQLEQQQSK